MPRLSSSRFEPASPTRWLLTLLAQPCLGIACGLLSFSHVQAQETSLRLPYHASFESLAPGSLTSEAASSGGPRWEAQEGHADITDRFAHHGRQSLHLKGGENRRVTLVFPESHERPLVLSFAAERWTARAPYLFRIEGLVSDEWQTLYHGDETVLVGQRFLSQIQCDLPKGTRAIRMVGSAPVSGGTLIDDVRIEEARPMTLVKISSSPRVTPVFIGKPNSQAGAYTIETSGHLQPLELREINLSFPEPTRLETLASVELTVNEQAFAKVASPATRTLTLAGSQHLRSGTNQVEVKVTLQPEATLDDTVALSLTALDLGEQTDLAPDHSSTIVQRVGHALRTAGQDACHTYRIPGLATTNAGSLIAVYDNRYRSSGDLPGDIDVGMSRSTDGGQSWEPMKVIMDMGNDPNWRYEGIGDPAILVDRKNGRIWVAATWSHGNRSWNGSGPGMKPEETGQLMLSYSDDDGLNWSKPINITKQIKRPEWRFVLQGPGMGICMKDGTLVFAAQFRGSDAKPALGRPSSTLIYSKDRGETWAIGTGVKIDTTEAQLVELGDGSIMINCRDNRNRAASDGMTGRTVATTKDLGKTWEMHATDRIALPEPTCMASLIRIEHESHGPLLVFSNPATPKGRFNMTLKISRDEGNSWPPEWHTLYDARLGAGYSCLAPIGQDHIGVLYEGNRELYFLRLPIDELLKANP